MVENLEQRVVQRTEAEIKREEQIAKSNFRNAVGMGAVALIFPPLTTTPLGLGVHALYNISHWEPEQRLSKNITETVVYSMTALVVQATTNGVITTAYDLFVKYAN